MTIDEPVAEWFKSIHSGSRTDCIEVELLPGDVVGVRDSKDPDGPVLHFTTDDWGVFSATITHQN
ncbi:DUF397 domain-containing protein [Nocardia terpenica]|uniref:DUF397 domain-containing protein n=1 Tax=Nocardia terpenica TaxID=455432 RepID=UPI002FE04440